MASDQTSPATPRIAGQNPAMAFLFLAALFALAWPIHPNTGWNVNTRLALVFAVVEQGTTRIDAYHDSGPTATNDKAVFDGHFYSDKIFGVSLLAIPPYWAITRLFGYTLEFQQAQAVLKGLVVALPGAASVLLFWLLLLRLGADPRRSLVLTMLLFGGSLWLGYGTVFYPYIPALATALGALHLAIYPPGGRPSLVATALVGFLLGYTLLFDLTQGIMVFGVACFWLLRLLHGAGWVPWAPFDTVKRDERLSIMRVVLHGVLFWLAVLLPLSVFFAWCRSVFGSFSIPYQYEFDEEFRLGMAQGFMGVTKPDVHALYFITLHPFRGIFFWTPLLVVAFGGTIALLLKRGGITALLALHGLLLSAAYLLFNCSYYMWWGGWSMGSRLLIPMIPFLGVGLLACCQPGNSLPRRGAWWLAVVAGIVSVALSLPLSLTDPQIPQGSKSEALYAATIADPPRVPQWRALQAFYRGEVSLWPTDRLRGVIGREERGRNAMSIFLYMAVVGGLVGGAVVVAGRAAEEEEG